MPSVCCSWSQRWHFLVSPGYSLVPAGASGSPATGEGLRNVQQRLLRCPVLLLMAAAGDSLKTLSLRQSFWVPAGSRPVLSSWPLVYPQYRAPAWPGVLPPPARYAQLSRIYPQECAESVRPLAIQSQLDKTRITGFPAIWFDNLSLVAWADLKCVRESGYKGVRGDSTPFKRIGSPSARQDP